MRIITLAYYNYGPFEEKHFNLANGAKGVHVFYGLNEAGKSTALRGLKRLLFGFPRSPDDNFRYDHRRQALEARIVAKSGRRLHFLRTRGRNQLRAGDGETCLDERVLQEFLGGLTEQQFDMLFGLDHASLVEGGHEIVEGQGDLGRALFTAGAGLVGLDDLRRQLEEHARSLFLAQGQKPRINTVLNSMAQAKVEEEQAMLDVRQYQKQLRTAKKATKKLKRLEQERREVQAEMDLLNGYQSALTSIRRLDGVASELRTLAERDPILDEEKAIHELLQQLGATRKAVQDQVRLRREADLKKAQARDLLQQHFRLEDLEKAVRLQPEETVRHRIHKLAQEYQARIEEREKSSEEAHRAELAIARFRSQLDNLPPIPDVRELRQTYESLASLGPLEDRLNELEAQLQRYIQKAENHRKRLALCFSGSVEEAVALPVPSLQTVEKYRKEFHALQERRTRLAETIEGIAKTLRDAESALMHIHQGGPIPSLEELQAARARRDRLLQKTRFVLLHPQEFDQHCAHRNADPQSARRKLIGRLRRHIALADELADRLRTEADRVAQRERWEEQKRIQAQEQHRLQEELAKLAARERELESAWEADWQPARITPRSPEEMLGWLQEHRQLVELMPEVRAATKTRDQLLDQIAKAKSRLLGLLSPAPDHAAQTLKELLLITKKHLEQAEQQIQHRQKLEQQLEIEERRLADCRHKVQSAEQRFTHWLEEWKAVVQGLHLDQTATPTLALERIDHIDRILSLWKEAQDLERRVADIDRDRDTFLGRLNALLRRLDQQSTPAGTDNMSELLDGLQARLSRAKGVEVRRARLCEEEKQYRAELAEKAGDRPVDQFIAEVLSHADNLSQRIQQLRGRQEDLNQEIRKLSSLVGSARSQVQEWNKASDLAFQRRQEREHHAALLPDLVMEYCAVIAARNILDQAVENFRQRNQSTLLDRAGYYFSLLTCNSFAGLDVDDSEGSPVLLAVRSPSEGEESELVPMDGLSDGTRDQLFLALRLAGIEQHLQRHEPMPVIADDILINFDDPRAAATLRCLGELAKKTQVLLFTHHRHLVELARKNLREKQNLFCHTF